MSLHSLQNTLQRLDAIVCDARAQLKTFECGAQAMCGAPDSQLRVGSRVRVTDPTSLQYNEWGVVARVDHSDGQQATARVAIAFDDLSACEFYSVTQVQRIVHERATELRSAAQAAINSCNETTATFRTCFMELRESFLAMTEDVKKAKLRKVMFDRELAHNTTQSNMQSSALVQFMNVGSDIFDKICDKHLCIQNILAVRASCKAMRSAGPTVKSIALTDAGSKNQQAAVLVLNPVCGKVGSLFMYTQKCTCLMLAHAESHSSNVLPMCFLVRNEYKRKGRQRFASGQNAEVELVPFQVRKEDGSGSTDEEEKQEHFVLMPEGRRAVQVCNKIRVEANATTKTCPTEQTFFHAREVLEVCAKQLQRRPVLCVSEKSVKNGVVFCTQALNAGNERKMMVKVVTMHVDDCGMHFKKVVEVDCKLLGKLPMSACCATDRVALSVWEGRKQVYAARFASTNGGFENVFTMTGGLFTAFVHHGWLRVQANSSIATIEGPRVLLATRKRSYLQCSVLADVGVVTMRNPAKVGSWRKQLGGSLYGCREKVQMVIEGTPRNACATVRLESVLTAEQKRQARPEEIVTYVGVLDTVALARANARKWKCTGPFDIEMHLQRLKVLDVIDKVQWTHIISPAQMQGEEETTVTIEASGTALNHGIFAPDSLHQLMWSRKLTISGGLGAFATTEEVVGAFVSFVESVEVARVCDLLLENEWIDSEEGCETTSGCGTAMQSVFEQEDSHGTWRFPHDEVFERFLCAIDSLWLQQCVNTVKCVFMHKDGLYEFDIPRSGLQHMDGSGVDYFTETSVMKAVRGVVGAQLDAQGVSTQVRERILNGVNIMNVRRFGSEVVVADLPQCDEWKDMKTLLNRCLDSFDGESTDTFIEKMTRFGKTLAAMRKCEESFGRTTEGGTDAVIVLLQFDLWHNQEVELGTIGPETRYVASKGKTCTFLECGGEETEWANTGSKCKDAYTSDLSREVTKTLQCFHACVKHLASVRLANSEGGLLFGVPVATQRTSAGGGFTRGMNVMQLSAEGGMLSSYGKELDNESLTRNNKKLTEGFSKAISSCDFSVVEGNMHHKV